jgi:hypothetical protein
VSTLNSEIKYITDDLAHHQATLAELAQAITEIKMARATERGYIAGALAVGGLLGGLAGNLLFRQFAG